MPGHSQGPFTGVCVDQGVVVAEEQAAKPPRNCATWQMKNSGSDMATPWLDFFWFCMHVFLFDIFEVQSSDSCPWPYRWYSCICLQYRLHIFPEWKVLCCWWTILGSSCETPTTTVQYAISMPNNEMMCTLGAVWFLFWSQDCLTILLLVFLPGTLLIAGGAIFASGVGIHIGGLLGEMM